MLTSLQNTNVKKWLKLHKAKGRKKYGMFLVEGFHLVEEAIKSRWMIETLIVEEGVKLPDWYASIEKVTVSSKIMEHLARTESPQGIIAIVRKQSISSNAKCGHILLIDALQDPGNLGTIIRTADAAGFDKILLGKNTVDLYNDKVIRATQGSIFHLPIDHIDLFDYIPRLQAEGFTVWASALEGAEFYQDVSTDGKTALIVGNEGSGIDSSIINLADKRVKIPIYGEAESLNASVAAGILMYHFRR